MTKLVVSRILSKVSVVVHTYCVIWYFIGVIGIVARQQVHDSYCSQECDIFTVSFVEGIKHFLNTGLQLWTIQKQEDYKAVE